MEGCVSRRYDAYATHVVNSLVSCGRSPAKIFREKQNHVGWERKARPYVFERFNAASKMDMYACTISGRNCPLEISVTPEKITATIYFNEGNDRMVLEMVTEKYAEAVRALEQ